MVYAGIAIITVPVKQTIPGVMQLSQDGLILANTDYVKQ